MAHITDVCLALAGLVTLMERWYRLMSIVKELFAIFSALLFVIAGFEDPNASGAQKKAMALAKIKAILADPGNPLNFPAWLAPLEDTLLGIGIDAAVDLANRSGFFAHSAAASSSSAAVPAQ